MLSKNEVKYIQSLYHKKTRTAANVFVAEGVKIIEELLKSDFGIVKIYALQHWMINHPEAANVIEISESELKKLSNLQTPNQVVAVVRKKGTHSTPDLRNTLSLLLDNIQDPGNMGTIIRIADWFGIKNIVAGDDAVDVYNPKVIQATMGSFIRVDVFYTNLHDFLKDCSVAVYGALLEGRDVRAIGSITEGVVVIGNESKGISKELLPFIQHAVTIPRKGDAESLNVAVATGIILSHINS